MLSSLALGLCTVALATYGAVCIVRTAYAASASHVARMKARLATRRMMRQIAREHTANLKAARDPLYIQAVLMAKLLEQLQVRSVADAARAYDGQREGFRARGGNRRVFVD